MTARTFTAVPAVRESVPLLVGLMGPSGSGKTFSALRLATGIQAVVGGDIYGVDSEARRMLHYADRFRRPDGSPGFKHVQFDAPFGSLDYLAAIRYCASQGAKIIIVDSMSHEHEGPGGLLDCQAREFERMEFKEAKKMLSWQKPKAARQAMLNGILQIPANFIFCFRAKEKVKMAKDDRGKQIVVPQGFMPIAGEELVYEQTVNCLLLPHADGVPTWQSDEPGERMMMKLPEQFREIFKEKRPLNEAIGQALAAWASGGAVGMRPTQSSGGSETSSTGDTTQTTSILLAKARDEATHGKDALQTFWKGLSQPDRRLVKTIMDELTATATEADAMREPATMEDVI